MPLGSDQEPDLFFEVADHIGSTPGAGGGAAGRSGAGGGGAGRSGAGGFDFRDSEDSE